MNQLADDLTNEDFKHFDRPFRLDKLLDHWAKFFAEVSGKKRKELWEGRLPAEDQEARTLVTGRHRRGSDAS